jgi:hypothetical protein
MDLTLSDSDSDEEFSDFVEVPIEREGDKVTAEGDKRHGETKTTEFNAL